MTAEGSGKDIVFDFNRRQRIGLSEAVMCGGKSPAQIANLLRLAQGRGTPLLLTRLEAPLFEAMADADQALLDYDAISRTAYLGPVPGPEGPVSVALVSAGTSDLPVVREAARTLGFYGQDTAEHLDIGVAGLWRLLEREEALRAYPIVIVVAGMDGALFSVVGGLLPASVIAVPTSTGYGAAHGGETALRSALTSCAPGILVTNIDNGYGAACAALRILNMRSAMA